MSNAPDNANPHVDELRLVESSMMMTRCGPSTERTWG